MEAVDLILIILVLWLVDIIDDFTALVVIAVGLLWFA